MDHKKKLLQTAVLLGIGVMSTLARAQTATDPWVRFGVATQRDAIAIDEPINWVMRLGAHNAYESYAYGHDTDPNQSLSITSMLSRGARIISLDVHVLDDDLWLCHNDYCAFDKASYDALIEEIGDFMSVRQDFVWVQIEYRPYAGCSFFGTPDNECNDGSLTLDEVATKLEDAIINHLDRGTGLVWRPNEAIEIGVNEFVHPNYSQLAEYCSGTGLFCVTSNDCPSGETCDSVIPSGATHRRRYPSLRELQVAGKRVMVTATGMTGCCGNDCGPYDVGAGQCSDHSLNAGDSCSSGGDCKGLEYATSWIWDDGNSGGVISGSGAGYNANGDTFDYINCESEDGNAIWSPTAETDGGYPIIPKVSEDRTVVGVFGTGAAIEFDEIGTLARCNAARINLDFFDAAEDMAAEACCALFGGPDCPFVAECPAEDFRVANTIWSWKYDQIPSESLNHDYVFMSGIDGRWNGAIPQNNFRCACGVARIGEPLDWQDKRGDTWEVTEATGFWDECPELCEAEFGTQNPPLVFELPVNGHANDRLWSALKSASDDAGSDLMYENVWMRFRRTDNGQWSKVVLPSIDSIEVTPNTTDPIFLDFTIRVKNSDDLPVQVFLDFEDGQRPILDSYTIENGLYVFRSSHGFLTEGDMTVVVDLYGSDDPSSTFLRLMESQDFDFTYDIPNNLPEIDALTSATRANLTEVCNTVCIGHLLQSTVQIYDADPEDDFTQPADCSTIRLCQRGVRVFYGDSDDSYCSGGFCTGASGGTISCTTDDECGQIIQPSQITSLGGGFYEFNLSNLYQEPGVFNGKIFVDDGKDEVMHEFTVFNLDPSVDPLILPNSSGCTASELFPGESVTCSIVFVDSNPDVDTYAIDMNWGDGTPVERFTNVTIGGTNAHTHLAFVSHTYNTSSSPDKFPIRVMVTDDAGLPGDSCSNDPAQACTADADCGSGNTCLPGICSSDLMTPCAADLDCGGTCRIPDSSNGSGDLCQANADCGSVCDNNPAQACSSNADCSSGGSCVSQICRAEDVCRIENASEVRYCLESGGICTSDADCASGACGGMFEVEVFEGNTPPIVCPIAQASCGNTSDTGGDVTINQGDTFSRTFRLVDPDANDMQELSVRYAPSLNAEFPPINGDQFTLEHTYNDPGTFELVFRVSSTFEGPITQNSTGALSFFVTVQSTNESPVFDAISPLQVPEGSLLTASIPFTDSDADTWTASVTYGDGATDPNATVDQADQTVDLSHTYLDNASYLASIVLSDGIATTVTAVPVTVTNAVPDVEVPIATDGAPDEGDALSVSATFTDPGANDGPFSCTIDYGDGSAPASGTISGNTCTGPGHAYDDNGAYEVAVNVTDKDGGVGSSTLTIDVSNVAPAADLTGPVNANEGTTFDLSLGGASDPSGADASAGFTYAFDCGDGYGPFAGDSTASCDALDDGIIDVGGIVRDKDGGETEYRTDLEVLNLPPDVQALTVDQDLAQVGEAVTASALFTDAGLLDTHTAEFDWDAALDPGRLLTTGTISYDGDTGQADATYAYVTPGLYTVAAEVADDDGGADSASVAHVIVFDPRGKYVTGAGSIKSLPGAYPSEPSHSSSGQFSFAVKYRDGQIIPMGDAQFDLRLSGLQFKAVSFDWLVVAGNRAQFKGRGEIDGVDDYDFTMIATDNHMQDTFRIRIWHRASGVVVYDNEMGDAIDADPVTATESGDIVIHTPRRSRR